MEKAAENDSGTAGAGIGMGMGFAMANQMGQTFSSKPTNETMPPPIPNAVYSYCSNRRTAERTICYPHSEGNGTTK